MTQNIQDIIDKHKKWLDSDGEEGEQANFSKMDLHEIELKGLNLSNSIFHNTNLTRARIENCRFDGSDFTNTDFSYSTCNNNFFTYCTFRNTNFEGSAIVHSDFSFSQFIKVNLTNISTRYLNFSFIKAKNSIFTNAVLLGANFTKAVLEYTNFDGANLSKIVFDETEFNSINLDQSIGVPAKNDIIEIESNNDKYLARKSQIKLLKRLEKIFYAFSIVLTSIIIFIIIYDLYDIYKGVTEEYRLHFNYFAWITLDITLVLLATTFNMLMNWIISDDNIHLEEIKNA